MLCILYVIAVGMCLGVVGTLVERTMPPTSPRRWVWCAIIPISIFLPGLYRFQHSWSVVDALEHHATRAQATESLGAASYSVLDPGWWTRTASFDSIINSVWHTASWLLFTWGVFNALRVAIIVYRSRAGQDDSRTGTVVDGVAVVITDAIGPATVGLLRSRVLIPRWVLAMPGVERRYVLCHEEEHRKAHDAHLLFAASLLLILMPWNLALWWQLRRLRLAIEMDCDSRVVTALGDADAYGEMLLKVAQASSRGPRLQPALLGGVGMLESRLVALLAPTPLRHVQRFLLPALAIGLVLVVLSTPHPVLGRGAHAHATVSPGATPATVAHFTGSAQTTAP